MSDFSIYWWNKQLGDEEIDKVADSIRNKRLSMGPVTAELERRLAEKLGVPYVVCTTSGTTALMCAMLALGVGCGDEIIVPNRTFIASAHAAALLGATIRIADVVDDRPVIDVNEVRKLITPRTKAIVPVYLNGCAPDMEALMALADEHSIPVVEDAAQGLFSLHKGRLAGTFGRFAGFSFSLGKLITSGQGGFVVCHAKEDYTKLRKVRSQGVFEVKKYFDYDTLGGNFKYTDVLASIALIQLEKVDRAIENQRTLYARYVEGFKGLKSVRMLPVDISRGELPVQAETLCSDRLRMQKELADRGIQAMIQTPDLNLSPQLGCRNHVFRNSPLYSDHTMILPSGPDQPLKNVDRVIEVVQTLDKDFPVLSA